MGVPVEFDKTITNVDGETAWLPLNRWGDSTCRITITTTSGAPVYSVVGTQDNVLRHNVTPTEIGVSGWEDITGDRSEVQPLLFRAIKVKVTAGTGTIRIRIQSEGAC
jgi:hypothetical protein